MTSSRDILIVGGGLAGLAAATQLAEAGFSVTVLEKNTYLGGRAASFTDKKTGDLVDHGQHLLIGAYQETRAFFERIGVFDKIAVQPQVRVDFVHPQMGESVLNCPDWPAPLHLVKGLLGLRHLSWVDKLAMAVGGAAFYLLNPTWFPALDRVSVRQLLRWLGQTSRSQQEFWDVLTIATLNEKPRHASAALFLRVMRDAFLFRRDYGRAWLPTTGLGELYDPAAADFIRQHGGEVRLRTRVRTFHVDPHRRVTVELKNGERLSASGVICALPPFILKSVLPVDIQEAHYPYLDQVEPRAILGINLWWDRPILERPFVGLLNSPIEWVFDKRQLYDPQKAQGHHLSLVVSAADDYNTTPKSDLIELAVSEIKRFFPAAREAELQHALVIKFKQATFSQRCGQAQFRPDVRTPFANVYLAGDWTNTGLPATIEGAVVSGHRVATAIQQDFG